MSRYGFFCFMSRVILRLMFRIRVFGLENVPRAGAFIIAPNHVSFLDPPAAGAFTGREVYYMARASLFGIPLLGRLIAWCNAFPVKRGAAEIRALKKALGVLEQGHGLLLFPEGRRNTGGGLKDGGAGVGMLAFRAGVPVIPVFIRGTEKALPAGARFVRSFRISVFYLEPVMPAGPATRAAYRGIAEEVMDRIRGKKRELEECRPK